MYLPFSIQPKQTILQRGQELLGCDGLKECANLQFGVAQDSCCPAASINVVMIHLIFQISCIYQFWDRVLILQLFWVKWVGPFLRKQPDGENPAHIFFTFSQGTDFAITYNSTYTGQKVKNHKLWPTQQTCQLLTATL